MQSKLTGGPVVFEQIFVISQSKRTSAS